MKRTVQDLLAERRCNAVELGRAKDKMERLMLQAHIDHLDRLIAAQVQP